MTSQRRQRVQRVGLLAAPAFAVALYLLLPDHYAGANGEQIGFEAGRITAAIAGWMAVWWLTEAIPLYATALLPLALLPTLGATSMEEAAAPYGHELIFLFMGGFILALALERWGLHRRVAFLALRLVGTRPAAIVGGFMLASAGLSMWVSNTATSIVMLPVALSVIDRTSSNGTSGAEADRFATCLLLGIAYAASIGGIGTLIGTPPNLFLASYASEHLEREIGFAEWMVVGLPLVVIFLPIAWWLLTHVLYSLPHHPIEGMDELSRHAEGSRGPFSRGERVTAVVFVATATAWICRPLLKDLSIAGVEPLAGLTDAGIAMMSAVLLFTIPIDWRERVFAMDWETAVKLPWGLLILFGGGLSLAAAIRSNGVGELLGAQVTTLAGTPPLLIVVALVAGVIFLTELTSNTATTATLIPILAGVAPGLGLDPILLVVPTAIAASCAFMLPVATPPNAVVFGSGRVEAAAMSRAGLRLNLVGIVLIPILTYAIAVPILGSAR